MPKTLSQSRPNVVGLEPLLPVTHQNEEAERSVLGAILLDNSALNLAAALLKPADFFHAHHQYLFRRMLLMAASKQAIDWVTLVHELQKHGELEKAGGPAYVSDLLAGRQAVTNVKFHCDIVLEKSAWRRGAHLTRTLYQEFLDGVEDSKVIFARGIKQFSEDEGDDRKAAVAIYTAPELAALAPDPVEYLVYPFAARGMVALVDGAAKAAGKTTLILTGIAASSRKELFLNRATKRMPVLYVSEENPRTLRMAI